MARDEERAPCQVAQARVTQRVELALELSGVKGRRYLEESLVAAGFARGDMTDFVTPAVGQRGPRDVDPETT